MAASSLRNVSTEKYFWIDADVVDHLIYRTRGGDWAKTVQKPVQLKNATFKFARKSRLSSGQEQF
jgi:hypothetical protein